MNYNSGGGNGKRPPNGRGAPNTEKASAATNNSKQKQRPTPSPGNSSGRTAVKSGNVPNRNARGNTERNIPADLKKKRGTINKPEKSPAPKKRTTQHEKEPDLQQKSLSKSVRKVSGEQNGSADKEEIAVPKIITPPKEPVNPYIKKMRRVMLGAVALLILIAICVGMSLTVFFKIDEITVEGKTRYAKEDIIAACMINKGDNLLLCDTSPGVKKIQEEFPYIEEVDIQKKIFNKINIAVTEAKPSSVVEYNGRYLVLSKSGKVIEINNQNKYKDIPEILGVKLKNVKLSSKIQYQDGNLAKYPDKILEGIGKYKISDIKKIDISDTTSIKLIRSNGFSIIIGTFADIEYKLQTAADILSKNVRENVSGTLDVSLASPNGGKSYLKLESEPSKVSSSPPKEESKKTQESKTEEESSGKPEESSEESVAEETSVGEESDYNDDTYYDDGYTDDTYTDDGYTDDTYTDDGYADDTYTDDGYTDDTYTDDGYADDTYTDDGYTDDTYTDDGYADDTYTDDGYTDDGYTDDYYANDGYGDDYY